MQIMTPEEAEHYRFDITDVTKVWPHVDFPPIKIGKLVLDRKNFVGNIVSHLSGVIKHIQLRQTAIFFKADPEYGKG